MSLPPVINIPKLKLNNGYEMPLVALGTYGTENDTENFINAIKYSIKIGYRHIDTAWLYNNEDAVGQAIREAIAESNGELKREDLFVVSKVWNTFHSRDRVKQVFNKTISDLGLDYLDLYLLHWPMGFKEGDDPLPADENGKRLYSDVHYLETYKAMEELVKEGRVRSIGISNFNLAQTQDILANCEIKPVNNQFEINPYIQCEKVVDFCQKNDIVVSGFCPVGGGQETPTLPGLKPLLKNDTILKLAEKYKKTPAQICLRWAVQKNIVVLPKSVKYQRLYENADLFNFTLSEEDMNELRGLNKNYRVYGNDDLKDHEFYPFAEVW